MDISLKSFITEDQIEQRKRIRQAEWELKRRPDQPLECPIETDTDHRTLYERLKEQKDKKQEEYEESKKLKHYIKVLDNDEVEFLEKIDEHKLNEMRNKLKEEKIAIEEFKKRVENLTESEQNKKLNEFKKCLFSKPTTSEPLNTNQQNRTINKRQTKLIQNAVVSVKRKTSDEENEKKELIKRKKEEDSDKNNEKDKNEKDKNEKDKNEKSNKGDGDKNQDNQDDNASSSINMEEQKPAFKVLGILPGLASYYSDSSDNSENDSDSSDDEQINSSELSQLFITNKRREIVRMKKALKKSGKHN